MSSVDLSQSETDERTLELASHDFGRTVRKRPRAVARPGSVQDVVDVIRKANLEGIPLTFQGAGHSQSGQSLSDQGVLVDMKGLDGIGEVENGQVLVQGGARWRDLVQRVYAKGYLPPALTTHLSVTVGGTLSVAGLSITSHRYGAQTDNVTELEVATGDGRLLRCSPERNSTLFDCARCGLGQFGAITEARIRLRRVLPRVRTYAVLYQDVREMMRDLEFLAGAERFQYIDGWCMPLPRDLWQMASGQLFAYRTYAVYLSVEWDDVPPDQEEMLGDLHYSLLQGVVDDTTLRFIARAETATFSHDRSGVWTQPGSGGETPSRKLKWFDDWGQAHPCTEGVLPWDSFADFITEVCDQLPGPVARTARIMLGPFRGERLKSPLFMRPEGELLMGYGILLEAPRSEMGEVLPILAGESRRIIEAGGKRYLSGWLDFDRKGWQEHFGKQWPRMLEWKKEFDPNYILNPGGMPLR